MPCTACPVHRIGTFYIVQNLQSDQGSPRSPSSQPQAGGRDPCTLRTSFLPPRHSPPTSSLLQGCSQQEGALKLSAVGFTSSDRFLKQHKVLVWLSGNLKLWRQSCPPPPAKKASAPGAGAGAA